MRNRIERTNLKKFPLTFSKIPPHPILIRLNYKFIDLDTKIFFTTLKPKNRVSSKKFKNSQICWRIPQTFTRKFFIFARKFIFREQEAQFRTKKSAKKSFLLQSIIYLLNYTY